MIKPLTINILSVTIICLSLAGCTTALPVETSDSSTDLPNYQTAQLNIEKILAADHLIPVRQENKLIVVDPQFSQPIEVYQFNADEIPLTSHPFDILMSPNNQWIVWYTPVKGIIALDLIKKQTMQIHPPSQWLSTNPYFEFSEQENVLYFVTDEGTVLNQYHLDQQQNFRIEIPYPFGNVFRISPDNQRVLFISGYGQANKQPEYMFTDIKGQSPQKFTTDTDISNRFLITWSPDGRGMIQVASGDLIYHPYDNPSSTQQLFHVTDDHILQIMRIHDLIYVLDDQEYWHIYSYSQKKEIARTPLSIAAELRKPTFYPWSEDQFLISELAGDESLQYYRLWTSNFRGSKKLLIPQFGEKLVQTQPLQLD